MSSGDLPAGECLSSKHHARAVTLLTLVGSGKIGTVARLPDKWRLLTLKILFKPTQVHRAKADLQNDQRVSLSMSTPNNPQDIAENETAKPHHPSCGPQRPDQPGRDHCDDHGRPLNPIQITQGNPLNLPAIKKREIQRGLIQFF